MIRIRWQALPWVLVVLVALGSLVCLGWSTWRERPDPAECPKSIACSLRYNDGTLTITLVNDSTHSLELSEWDSNSGGWLNHIHIDRDGIEMPNHSPCVNFQRPNWSLFDEPTTLLHPGEHLTVKLRLATCFDPLDPGIYLVSVDKLLFDCGSTNVVELRAQTEITLH